MPLIIESREVAHVSILDVKGRIVLDTTGSDTSAEYQIDYTGAGNQAPAVRRVPLSTRRPAGRAEPRKP